jgi:hypothetical protein
MDAQAFLPFNFTNRAYIPDESITRYALFARFSEPQSNPDCFYAHVLKNIYPTTVILEITPAVKGV